MNIAGIGAQITKHAILRRKLDDWRFGKAQFRYPVTNRDGEHVRKSCLRSCGPDWLVVNVGSTKGELTGRSESGTLCLECGEWSVSCTEPSDEWV